VSLLVSCAFERGVGSLPLVVKCWGVFGPLHEKAFFQMARKVGTEFSMSS
jgi:hypothetical protein